MKNYYKFCSLCGNKLRPDGKNLRCARCPFVNYRNPRPTATALILHKNKILLTKRKNPPFKNQWDLPGGFLDRGENFEEGLKRELSEELGLKNFSCKFFGTYAGTYQFGKDPFYVVSAVFVVKPRSPRFSIEDRQELKDARWFLKKELPRKIAFDSNQKIVEDFKKMWK